jgi:hypothetical protein
MLIWIKAPFDLFADHQKDISFSGHQLREGVFMLKIALLSLATIGSELTTLVSDRVPHFNVEALCRATADDDPPCY